MRRRSYGTSYDHCLRVAVALFKEFHVNDPIVVVAGILHDLVEDSPCDISLVKSIFGVEIADLVSWLDRGDPKWERLEHGCEDRNIVKIIQNHSIMQTETPKALIKSVDKLDNLRDMNLIPPNDSKYLRIPFWVVEIRLSILPYTDRYYPDTASAIRKELASVEANFINDIPRLLDRYTTKMKEALIIWEEI